MANKNIVRLIDSYTGENVNYEEVAAWHDGTQMDDSKVDNVIYRKAHEKYYKRLFSGRVDVRWFGAQGDDITDDTGSIQRAVDVTAMLSLILFFPAGTYLVKAHVDGFNGNIMRNQGGVHLKSNCVLKLDENAIIKIINNNYGSYNALRTYGDNNIIIEGGQIMGDRKTHSGTDGEWGFGIAIFGSKDVKIKGMTIRDCWGDAIDLQPIVESGDILYCDNIIIEDVVCDNNRRQGLSIECGHNIVVRKSVFKNTNGVPPQAGIDIEPWNQAISVDNVIIEDCVFIDNQANGVLINYPTISNVIVDRCRFYASSSESVYQHLLTTFKECQAVVSNCYFDEKVSNVLVRGGHILFTNNTFSNKIDINYPGDLLLHESSVSFLNNIFEKGVQLACDDKNKFLEFRKNHLKENCLLLLKTNKAVISDNFFEAVDSKCIELITSGHEVQGNYFTSAGYACIVIKNLNNVSGNYFGKGDLGILISSIPSVGNEISLNSFYTNTAINFANTTYEGNNSNNIIANNYAYANLINSTSYYGLVARGNIVKVGDTYYVGNGVFPEGIKNGDKVFDEELSTGYIYPFKNIGTTAERPSNAPIGFEYTDTDLKKKIVYWGAEGWKNVDGSVLA